MRFVVDRFDKRIKGSFPDVNFPINGNFVVRIPPAVAVRSDPTMTFADLLTRKDAGILSYYSGFNYIISEDFLNASGIDIPVVFDPTMLFAGIGENNVLSFNPNSTYLLPTDGVNEGKIITKTVTLVSPPVNTNVIVYWEIFQLANIEDTTTKVVGQYYSEIDSDQITCEISMNNGANWESIYNNTFTELINTGSQVKLRFTNDGAYSGQKVWLGYSAILHT
jgi:hypothetical protein